MFGIDNGNVKELFNLHDVDLNHENILNLEQQYVYEEDDC